MERCRIGVDIGGTFTDIVLLNPDGSVHTRKVSSSADDYARAIMEGLRDVFQETGLRGGQVGEVIHGTTVASNAILELRGAHFLEEVPVDQLAIVAHGMLPSAARPSFSRTHLMSFSRVRLRSMWIAAVEVSSRWAISSQLCSRS